MVRALSSAARIFCRFLLMLGIVDSEEKIQKLISFLDEVVDEGLIATSEAEVIKYVHQAATCA
jgi:PII-like signaling protein